MDSFGKFLDAITRYGFEKIGLYYSSYRATVYSNEDPDSLNRLQLIIPHISSDPLPAWVFPKSNFAGKEYGMQVLPQKGDLVKVEFEYGNPKKPLWLHGYFGEKEKPTGDNYKDVKNYWFRTPSGNLVELYDDECIRLTDQWGNILVLNKNGISQISKNISQGTLDKSAQPGVLGDTNAEVLQDLWDNLNNLNTALRLYAEAQAKIAVAVPIYIGLAPALQATAALSNAIELVLPAIAQLIPQTKSKVVTLD
jgi:hypothetical protein